MFNSKVNYRSLILFIFGIIPQIIFSQNPIFSVDSNYLQKHDIVYNSPAYEGFEGFPIGNGDVGGMVWNTKSGYEIQINKNDLFDSQNEESRSTLRNGVRINIDLGAPGFEWMYLNSFTGRLSLQSADISYDALTPFMTNKMNTWVSAKKNIWFVQLESKVKKPLLAATKLRVTMERWGSRTFPGWYGYFSKDATSGLAVTRSMVQDNIIVLEVNYKSLRFSVACKILGEEATSHIISSNRIELTSTSALQNHHSSLAFSIVTSFESANPTRSAIALLKGINREDIRTDKKEHREFWKKFWQKSFVHLENDYLENTYYLRRYLMGSSSRGRFPVVFNGGLWTWNHDVRNWVTPHHWNTQQQYWGLCSQNDCELMLPYLNTYFNLMPYAFSFAKKRGAQHSILWSEPHDFFGDMTFWDRGDMVNDYTPASQMAGMFWEYFQYTSDTVFLLKKAYPFMKAAAEFYLEKIKWDSTKKQFYIFPSQPYESPRSNQLLNPVTDRSMIISNFSHCIQAAKMLGLDNEKIQIWNNVIDHIWPIPFRTMPDKEEVIDLAWYPDGTLFPKLDDHGKWLNAMSQNTSSVFPAGIIGISSKGSREFTALNNIVEHHSVAVNAISPDPIVAARLGNGEAAIRMIENGVRRLQHFPQGLFYNIDHWYNLSLYMDSLKTPDLSAQRDYIYDERSHYPNKLPAKEFIQCGLEPQSIYGTAINEMLLQSNEGVIRIFPAVPKSWGAAFTLLARSNFLVSSEMKKDGSISGVYIESKNGNTCSLFNPWPDPKVIIKDSNNSVINQNLNAANIISFKTDPGHSYIILPVLKDIKIEKVNFISKMNMEPKKYFEAVLGKERNF